MEDNGVKDIRGTSQALRLDKEKKKNKSSGKGGGGKEKKT